MGDLDHVFRQVYAGHVFDHVAQRAAGQARPAAEIEQALERTEAQGLKPLANQNRNVIFELFDEHVLEDLGMLVEQGRDIGVRRLVGCFAAAHGGDAHGRSAMILGIDGQHFLIGFDGGLDIAGFFQRERTVIGFRQGFFVDLFHGGVFKGPRGNWQWPSSRKASRCVPRARRVLRSQDEAQLMMNSPFSARQSVAEISLR